MNRSEKIPRLLAVMTPFPYSIDNMSSLSAARKMMSEHHIHHLPVTDEGELVGIVADKDLIAWPSHGEDDSEMAVADISKADVYLADLYDPLDRVLGVMVDRHLGSVLVTKEGELVGIFTSNDACRLFAQSLADSRPGEYPDQIA